MSSKRTPLTELEHSILAKLSLARFPPATASKRFASDLASGYVKELSSKGRKFLAYVVHRFRRQYVLTSAEQGWVDEWLNAEITPDIAPPPKGSHMPLENIQAVLDFERDS